MYLAYLVMSVTKLSIYTDKPLVGPALSGRAPWGCTKFPHRQGRLRQLTEDVIVELMARSGQILG